MVRTGRMRTLLLIIVMTLIEREELGSGMDCLPSCLLSFLSWVDLAFLIPHLQDRCITYFESSWELSEAMWESIHRGAWHMLDPPEVIGLHLFCSQEGLSKSWHTFPHLHFGWSLML